MAAKADLDNFNATRLSFIVSGGITLDVSGKNLLIDIRYHLPLTKSNMYTSSLAFDDAASDNNEVFSIFGKTDAELYAPQYPLNDFKTGRITLGVSMLLF